MREAFRSFSQPGSNTIFLKQSASKLYSLTRDQRNTAVASYLNQYYPCTPLSGTYKI